MSSERKQALERKRRVFELLDEALECPPRDRTGFLDEACAEDPTLRREVEALLETDAEQGVLAEPAFSVHAEDADLGRRIDSYKLVRLLDRGGMGTVYLAEREDFEQRVALKLIRRGLDVDEVFVRRFHNERQILAGLEHPYIARLLDGGTTADRLPYFVMEFVEGKPLDRYCEARQLSIEERLELFCDVCSAVQFAHQNLVIHRDLKPGNILITADATPKLLDFGIAKLLDHGLAAQTVATAPGQGPMTPRYASPEQIRLEPLTTASDVYSLGVLLYELLTGLDPYQVKAHRSDEVARAVCEQEPDKPSTAVRRRAAERGTAGSDASDSNKLRRRLSGDLDSIVLKAMRKEPSERYGSAERLSEDIRRHLTGLPVKARVGSFAYLTGKLVRRYKVAAAFLLLILSFSVVSTVLWRQAVHERRRAQQERQGAQTAYRFLQNLFETADPDQARGADLTALEILERGKERVVEELKEEPELQIDVAGTLGKVFRNLGAYDESKEMMAMSLRIARETYGGDHPEVAKRLGNLAVLTYDHQDYPQAESLFRGILEMKLRLGQQASELFRAKGNLAATLMLQGKFDEAEELYLDILKTRLELYEPEYGPNDEDVATSRRNLGALYYDQGDFEKAESQLRKSLEIRRRVFGSEHTGVASVQNLLGNVLAAQGREDEAEQLYDEALSTRRSLLGEDHPHVARTKRDLAELLAHRDAATARVLLSQALATFYRTRPDGWEAADAESVLGAILTGMGRYEEAEPCLVGAHAKLEEVRSGRSFRTRKALARLLDLYRAWDHPEELDRYQAVAAGEG